jgi:hypothetical protein
MREALGYMFSKAEYKITEMNWDKIRISETNKILKHYLLILLEEVDTLTDQGKDVLHTNLESEQATDLSRVDSDHHNDDEMHTDGDNGNI